MCIVFHLIFFVSFFSYFVVVILGFAGIILISVGGSKFLLDSLLGGLRQIRCLYVLLHTNQRFFQSVERTRVQHLLLDFGRVGTPRHQKQLLFLGSLIEYKCRYFFILPVLFILSRKKLLQKITLPRMYPDIDECIQNRRDRNGILRHHLSANLQGRRRKPRREVR